MQSRVDEFFTKTRARADGFQLGDINVPIRLTT